MERLLPGVDLQLRQQHQHPRGRLAPFRLPRGADPDAQRLRPRQRPAQRERRQPRRRGRARGPDRGDLGQAARPPVRGPDQDQTRQPADPRPGRGDRQPQAGRVPRGESERRAADHRQDDRRLACPRRGPQGARPDPTQVGAGELDPARQAGRLHGQGPEPGRDLRGRGRLRRRLGEAGARPQHPGGAAAARQDHQRREEPHRQGARQQRGPGADHGDRHRRPRRVQPRGRQVPQDRDGDRRRRRRRPHPHPRPHLPLPADAGADRRRLRLHRQTAALPGQAGQPGDLPGARVRTGRAAAARQDRGVRAGRRQRSTRRSSRRAAGRATSAAAKEYEGWGSSLQAEFGHEMVRFLEESSLLDEEVGDARRRPQGAEPQGGREPSHSTPRSSRTPTPACA